MASYCEKLREVVATTDIPGIVTTSDATSASDGEKNGGEDIGELNPTDAGIESSVSVDNVDGADDDSAQDSTSSDDEASSSDNSPNVGHLASVSRALSPIPDASEGEENDAVSNLTDTDDDEPAMPAARDKFHGALKKVSFHIDGDLIIKVYEPPGFILYEVCASNVAAASPVWRRMIYGGGHPCPDHGPWIIDMTDMDDDAFGLDVIFSIVHHKYHQIQERYIVTELYKIALVADKYECTPLLVPWMKEWMAGLHHNVVMNDDQNDNDKTLFVTWVFGDLERLAKVINKCAHNASVDENNLLDSHGRPWASYGLPMEIVDTMQDMRASTVKSLLEAMSTPMEYLLQPGNRDVENKFKYCRARNDPDATRQSCEHLQLGSALSGLISRGLYPFPKPEQWTGSAESLATAYRSLEVGRYKVPGARPHQDDHRGCGFDQMGVIEEIMRTPAILTAGVVAQLKTQALRCGAYKDQIFLQVDGSIGDAKQATEELRRDYPSLFKEVTMPPKYEPIV